jgi:phosphoadenosine phosphosulfate reductase
VSAVIRTTRQVAEKAATAETVLVAFSGGKDSLVVLDLCRRHFRHVTAFHLDLVPGLAWVRERVDDYLAGLGISVAHYLDPVVLHALRDGLFCDARPEYADLPRFSSADAYRMAAADAGVPIEYLADGKKESDYRQRAFHLRGGRLPGWHPLAKWTKADVLGYLRWAGILPPESHVEAGGIDLTRSSLLWLHDRHPADFRRVQEWFPYVEAVVKRRDWFPESYPVRPVRRRVDPPA